MNEDVRDQERCTACNHLVTFHSDRGCFAMAIGEDISLHKCVCVRVSDTMQSFRGAVSYEEIKVSLPIENFDETEGFFTPNGYFHYYEGN